MTEKNILYWVTKLGKNISAGTEIKKGKKYERIDFQILSESELNALLKSKSAKRLNSETEKNTKTYLDWLFHNNN